MIATKQQMYRELKSGRLGNSLRVWNGLAPVLESGYNGTVGLRHVTISGHPIAALPGVRPNQLPDRLKEYNLAWPDVIVQEGAPDEKLVVQGEAMRSPQGLVLRISYEKVMMRIAMQKAIHLKGVRANALLRTLLTPASYDDLMELLDEHDNGPQGVDTVVEFGVYAMPLGHAKQRNMIVWETRSY